MSLATIIILVNLLGFTMLFMHLLTRDRKPRITTITRRPEPRPRVITHNPNSDAE